MSVTVTLQCVVHPRYQAKRFSMTGCWACDEIYYIVNDKSRDPSVDDLKVTRVEAADPIVNVHGVRVGARKK